MKKSRSYTAILGVISIVTIVGGLALSATSTHAIKKDPYLFPKTIPVPSDNKLTTARIKLGKLLFFDPRLSGSGTMSCATCHNPALGWSDGLPTAVGNKMKVLSRSTPTIVNSAYNTIFMWDGRAPSLEAQATGPIKADAEMNQDMVILVEKLAKIPGYYKLFERAYPGEGIIEKTIAKAIASYERTVISKNAPFDRWRRGNRNAVSKSAKRGFKLFTGKAKCSTCHEGFNFTDNGFHNIGLKKRKGMKKDVGRYAQRKVAVLKGAFKTPTLRDIVLTAPYMHNGAYNTLEEVVEHYVRGGDVKKNLSPDMKKIDLSEQEKADLVMFMRTLTGKQVKVTIPLLPQ